MSGLSLVVMMVESVSSRDLGAKSLQLREPVPTVVHKLATFAFEPAGPVRAGAAPAPSIRDDGECSAV